MKYKFGSNYVPAETTMPMKEEYMKIDVIGMIDNERDDSENEIQ